MQIQTILLITITKLWHVLQKNVILRLKLTRRVRFVLLVG